MGDEDNIYRDMVRIALEQLHAQGKRIAALEEQLAALREELRRYVAARVHEATRD